MGQPDATRAVFLKRRTAQSGPVLDDFEIRDLGLPGLQEGELLVRNAYMSVDPSMRGRRAQGGSGRVHEKQGLDSARTTPGLDPMLHDGIVAWLPPTPSESRRSGVGGG